MLEERALKHFGEYHQKIKLIEEMAELMQAIIKNSNVEEEMADVQIVLDQLKVIYPGWSNHREIKLFRLEEILNEVQKQKNNS